MTDAPDYSLPLPIYSSIRAGEMTGKDNDQYAILVGLDEAHVRELKEKSLDENDTELMNNTSDKRRFGVGSYEDWYKKDRTPFALLSPTGQLAALVFIGPAPLPKGILDDSAQEWDTIGFRSYAPYRGKGLMTKFSLAAIDLYRAKRPGRGLWLEVNSDNDAGKHLYSKVGFTNAGKTPSGRAVMVRAS